jgi:hypothetical protein
MAVVETVKVQKDGETVTINKSDLKDWQGNGWAAEGSKAPEAPIPPSEDGYKAVCRSRGKWDVVKIEDGKEVGDNLNEEPMLKADAEALAEEANAEE